MRSSDATTTETGSGVTLRTPINAEATANARTEAEAGPDPVASLPMPPAPPHPVQDLGTMIGFSPRILHGCLGWHIAVQPGPAVHAPVSRLPPVLWLTSALCPMLVLPPASAAVERGHAVRVPPAIRAPNLRAWEQAIVLIVRRNREAFRYRRDGLATAAKATASPRPAASRPGAAVADAAGSAHGKDLMHRGTHRALRSEAQAAGLPPIADVFATTPGARAALCLEDLVRRESAASVMRDPAAAASWSAARPTSAFTVTATPAHAEHPLRRENGTSATFLSATSAKASGDGASSNPPPATANALSAQDPVHRETATSHRGGTEAPIPPRAQAAATPGNVEDPTRREAPSPRTGPLRNGNPRGNPNLAPRCGARTRQGCPCKGPAMRNGRCRMHGGKSTGPRTAEGLARLRAAARARHGGEAAAEARAFTRSCRVLIRHTRALLALVERPAENRPALGAKALFDALPPLPLAVPLCGPLLPPGQRTDGRSPYAVRADLPDQPSGPGDLATAGRGFGPFPALHPPHAMRQDRVRREKQPLSRLPAARGALPDLAQAVRPPAGATAVREYSPRP
ncbi:MAG TPA: HGGxSTG domain-containing protein [Acetobacteraceae bacterium]|nr:HGGxSTG domain-containing protein [Acetobacteraceae bacterium]